MEEVELTRITQLEDVPNELIQRIQLLLPAKEAARTCVLSKSWLQAWSTNPTLRFRQSVNTSNNQQQTKYMNFINRTLLRYSRDNLPITSFKLQIVIEDGKSVSFVKKWIRHLISKSCVTEIYLKLYIYMDSFQLSDEIYFDETFSGKKRKKVSLRMFTLTGRSWMVPISPVTDKLASVTELSLDLYDVGLNLRELFKSKFPYLESLTLTFRWCVMIDISDIICVSLKRLIIKAQPNQLLRVQIVAPKLLFFSYTGDDVTTPSILFPAIAPQRIELNLKLNKPIDISFFLKLRETLRLSSKFNIKISTGYKFIKQFEVDIDDLRRQVSRPATNVQKLSFETYPGDDLWGHSEFFDSFSSICNPSISPTSKILKKKSFAVGNFNKSSGPVFMDWNSLNFKWSL